MFGIFKSIFETSYNASCYTAMVDSQIYLSNRLNKLEKCLKPHAVKFYERFQVNTVGDFLQAKHAFVVFEFLDSKEQLIQIQAELGGVEDGTVVRINLKQVFEIKYSDMYTFTPIPTLDLQKILDCCQVFLSQEERRIYKLVTNNCYHFTQFMCERLTTDATGVTSPSHRLNIETNRMFGISVEMLLQAGGATMFAPIFALSHMIAYYYKKIKQQTPA